MPDDRAFTGSAGNKDGASPALDGQVAAIVKSILSEASESARARVAQFLPNATPEEIELVTRAVKEAIALRSGAQLGAGSADLGEFVKLLRAIVETTRSAPAQTSGVAPFSYAPSSLFAASAALPSQPPATPYPYSSPTESARPAAPSAFPYSQPAPSSLSPIAASSSARPVASSADVSKSVPSVPIAEKLGPNPAPSSGLERVSVPRERPSSKSAPSRRGARSRSASSSASKPEPTPDSLEALALGASVQPTRSADEFLASAALQESARTESEPSFDALAVGDSKDAPGANEFLAQLSQEAPKNAESDMASAEQVEFLRNRSAMETAAEVAPMWLLSLLAHLALVLILAFIVVNVDRKSDFEIVSEPGFSDEVVLDEVFDPEATFEANEQIDVDANMPDVKADVVADVPDASAFDEENAAALSLADTALSLDSVPTGDVDNLLGSLNGDDLSGRGSNKAAALATGGGSEGSEKSVALALAWLAEHQLPDGSWTFMLDHVPSCGGRCANSGTHKSLNAATAMGLLPFLAAGNTPTKGKYKKVVARGIEFLLDNCQRTENGTRFNDEGQMYAHGLAAIAICEACAMLSDRERSKFGKLSYAAQEAIEFIEYAQADDGGWRYEPKQPGDTSVVGWQMMALKSGQLSGMVVDDSVVRAARDFLRDVVSVEDGTRYCYMRASSESPATDSIGLLCRLYLDWRVDNPQLIAGSTRIADMGPDFGNPYFNYYATQLLHNIGGELWNRWNRATRDALVSSQCLEGHERGSWFPPNPDGHCATGGRLFATSLNCLILEAYYRHMPLFQKMEDGSQFPLDAQ